MLKKKPFDNKMHKNRNKEFFLEITEKYEVLSRNSFFHMPRLIYRNSPPMFTNITRGCLPLKVEFNTQKAAPEVYTINNYNIRNISLHDRHTTSEKLHVAYGEKKGDYYAAGSGIEGTYGYSSNVFIGHTNMIGYIYDGKTHEKPLNGDITSFIGVNGIMRHYFVGNRNSESKLVSNAFLHGLQKNQDVIRSLPHNVYRTAVLTGESILSSRRLINKNEDGNSKDASHIGSKSTGYNDHHSIVHMDKGGFPQKNNTYGDSPDMEFAKIQHPQAALPKDEFSVQNIAANEINNRIAETTFDMKKLVNQVYKELERRIRIERERRGL